MADDYGVLIKTEGFPLRGLFIIDDKGIIRSVTVNDTQVGRSVEECMRVV
jgi:alkyl hydroperoxide reductase subunit AhpC